METYVINSILNMRVEKLFQQRMHGFRRITRQSFCRIRLRTLESAITAKKNQDLMQRHYFLEKKNPFKRNSCKIY
jgi:hypothetical protein